MEKMQPPLTFLTATPLQLQFALASGMLWAMFSSTFAAFNPPTKTAEEIVQPVRVGMTRGVAQQLFTDIYRLESSLASPGKPSSESHAAS
jgi:hypothetical protein